MKLLVAIGLLASAGVVQAAQSPQDFAYGMRLEADGNEALYEVVLPATVYRGVVRADLADVRVFNGAGEVVPHAWMPRSTAEPESASPVALTLFPLRADEGSGVDGIAIRVRRGADGTVDVDVTSSGARPGSVKRTVGYLVDLTTLDRALQAIELEWRPVPDGFAARVRVDASDDLGSWRTLVAEAPLVSLEVGGQRLRHNRVELPRQRARYLRLSWVAEGATSALPELASARGEAVGHTVEAAREWTGAGAGKGDRPGEYLFDLRGHHPIDRVRVHLPEPNTVAQVEWLVRDGMERPWRPVASGVVYRLRRNGSEVASPEVPVGVATERYWLLRVDQRGGGVGSGAPRLEAGWIPHTLVFAARGEPPFLLAYGNRGAGPAAYPIATLIPGYDGDRGPRIPTAGAGAQHAINVSSARALEQRELGGEAQREEAVDWKRWSLWASLALGVIVLGGMAWRLVRQMDSGGASRPGDSGRPE